MSHNVPGVSEVRASKLHIFTDLEGLIDPLFRSLSAQLGFGRSAIGTEPETLVLYETALRGSRYLRFCGIILVRRNEVTPRTASLLSKHST